jgi:hypothetical protein
MTNRFAIVPCPDGSPLPAEAIMIGDLDEVMQFLPQTVAYQELESRALGLVDQLDQRERTLSDGVQALTESVGKFMDACGRLVDGEEEREAEQIRLDEEEKARAEAAEIEAYLAAHPEPASLSDESPHAGGELHPHAPVDKEHLDPEGSEADAGGVALSYPRVPESYIRGEEAEDLEESGIGGASYPEPDLEDLGGSKDPKVVPQPISTSFW